MDALVFGTDGWRDIIGDRFTFTNVARAAQAYAGHLVDGGGTRVVVGHDTRFNGQLFARRVAEVLAANGLEVLLIRGSVPTPALSFAVRHHSAAGGVMLTASHNPPAYNGFKLKGPYGGTATDAIYRDVSGRLPATDPQAIPAYDGSRHTIESLDIRDAYFVALAALADLEAIGQLGGLVVHDGMGGAAGGWLQAFAHEAGLPLEVRSVRGAPDPLFYGVNPEPLPHNLEAVRRRLPEWGQGLHFVAVTDGDGDRIGAMLPDGRFFNSHQIFAVLLDLLHGKGLTGTVVKTFTVSRVVERLAAARGLEVSETPVGFKHIVNAMLQGGVLIGGEESGGIGVAGHIPERDGLANSLLLLEAVARRGAGLEQIFEAIEHEAGWRHAYDRLDLHLAGNALVDSVMGRIEDPPSRIADLEVGSVETRDGVKVNLGDQAWLLFRPSGTEPVLRIYCEASDPAEVERILIWAERFVVDR